MALANSPSRWMNHRHDGSCFPDELIEIERTDEPWVRRKVSVTT